MLSKQQKEYLDAMGVSVWLLREPPVLETENSAETAPGESAEFTLDAPSVPAVDIATERLPEIAVDAPVLPVSEPPVETRTDIPGLKLGPGRGGILLVCARDSDSASRLANDISRALGSVPVWAWPDSSTGAVQLADAVEENLFTTVAVFGDDLAQQFFAAEVPSSVHAANLVRLPSMHDIEAQPEARRTLWAALCRSGMVSRS